MTKINRGSLAGSWRAWIDNDPTHRVGPWWLAWLWTLRFCAGLAVPFTGFGFFAAASSRDAWPSWQEGVGLYGKYFVVTLAIGAVIHLLFDAGRRLYATPRRVRAWKPWQRTLYFSGLPLFGVALGWPLGMALVEADALERIMSGGGSRTLVGVLLGSLLIAFLFHHYFSARAQQLQAEKRAAEAQLRLLQAQIEPHFLFNTLANVISLIDHDTPRAKQMLESFTDYLRSSLSSLRHDQATLGSELDLAQAYLCLLKMRMEDRLVFSIDTDPAVRDARLPPLLLQPLVENAIHHGLEPKVEGGHVCVRASVQGATLVIEVADDGLGLHAPPRRKTGAGLALNNLRERLWAQYGAEASLTLTEAQPGTVATLRLPHEVAIA